MEGILWGYLIAVAGLADAERTDRKTRHYGAERSGPGVTAVEKVRTYVRFPARVLKWTGERGARKGGQGKSRVEQSREEESRAVKQLGGGMRHSYWDGLLFRGWI
jgi:hypothetical protein